MPKLSQTSLGRSSLLRFLRTLYARVKELEADNPMIPNRPKIYHIIHIDRLLSVIRHGHLWSDLAILQNPSLFSGTNIGNQQIKERRRTLNLRSHTGLKVGNCVPFYFCPRSPMLYIISRGEDSWLTTYQGGQNQIVHLQADMYQTISWAANNGLHWAFTDINAAKDGFNDWSDLTHLNKIDWAAIEATLWAAFTERKQAEFLIQSRFPWNLVDLIGVSTRETLDKIVEYMKYSNHRPNVGIIEDWYY